MLGCGEVSSLRWYQQRDAEYDYGGQDTVARCSCYMVPSYGLPSTWLPSYNLAVTRGCIRDNYCQSSAYATVSSTSLPSSLLVQMAQVISCNPRRYFSYACVDGFTKVTTHMEVRVYDAESTSNNKMINVLVDVHQFDVGNGIEKALFKVYSLKEALRRTRACYNQLIIYVYKGKLNGNNGMEIDTDMGRTAR